MADPKRGKGPIQIYETPGKRSYCTCGWSESLPYCDGAHNRMNTGCKSCKVELTEPGMRWVCQCGKSSTPPWCDGSHERP